MIYRLRVILDNDTEDDIFRDIELDKTSNLEDFHNTITQSFGFEGNEMASFYLTDKEWNQGEEISLFDLGDLGQTNRLMSDILDVPTSSPHGRPTSWASFTLTTCGMTLPKPGKPLMSASRSSTPWWQ